MHYPVSSCFWFLASVSGRDGDGGLVLRMQGHGHWVNTLALSTEYVLRTGPFDHTGKQYSSSEEMKKVHVKQFSSYRVSGIGLSYCILYF
jgi:hypothetical protein